MSFFFPRMLGQQEYENERGCQGDEADPCNDPESVGRRVVFEQREEDGAENRNAERGRTAQHHSVPTIL